jgi:IS5 family transposase
VVPRPRQEAQATVVRITGELAGLLDQTAAEATAVVRNARRWLPRASGHARGRLVRAVNELDTLLDRAARVSDQARLRLDGGKPDSATRLVSLHDSQARPIRKGRVDRPSCSATKPKSLTTPTASCWTTTWKRATRPTDPAGTGDPPHPPPRRQIPRAVAADRGYGEARIEAQLHDLGVQQVAIPRKGATGASRRNHEQRPAFRRLVKWRTGCEGRISHLKHRYGWHRTRLTTSPAPEPGADTASSPTTSSKSPP